MPSDEFRVANRRNWDERVPIHRRDRTGFYAVERFLAGEKQLHAIELGELGDVAGKRLIHLQCHFGIDTLILARHGAITTGLDFSPVAIEEARRLADGLGCYVHAVMATDGGAQSIIAHGADRVHVTANPAAYLAGQQPEVVPVAAVQPEQVLRAGRQGRQALFLHVALAQQPA